MGLSGEKREKSKRGKRGRGKREEGIGDWGDRREERGEGRK